MASALTALAATDPATKLADWLELTALAAADRNASIQDLVQVIRRSGTSDAIDPDNEEPSGDRGSEISQAIAESAFAEIEARSTGCGKAYPFKVGTQRIQATRSTDASIYVFLLLVANYGAKAAGSGTSALPMFDDLAAGAAGSYFHGESYVFAFPRRVAPTGFADAVDDLCLRMGEGEGNRRRPTTKHQNDAKLDIVSWRPFEDRRKGKMIAFGQCATGANWKEKLSELDPYDFYTQWFAENPAVRPLRMFFMPFRVLDDDWFGVALKGGVVFDRCRLAHHAQSVDSALKEQVSAWNRDVLAKKVRT
jgi:hypothetical protein